MDFCFSQWVISHWYIIIYFDVPFPRFVQWESLQCDVLLIWIHHPVSTFLLSGARRWSRIICSFSAPALESHFSLRSHGNFFFFFFKLYLETRMWVWHVCFFYCVAASTTSWWTDGLDYFKHWSVCLFLTIFCYKGKTLIQKVWEREKIIHTLITPNNNYLTFCFFLSIFSYTFKCIASILMIFVSCIFHFCALFFHLAT